MLTRGPVAFFEFDQKGAYVRSFGEGLFTRAHGLRIDREGNLWAGDVGAHTVRKFGRDGQVLLTIGTKGEAGEWNEAAGSRRLNQPNDVAIADNGDIFIVQGHTPGPRGDARVLKFDKTGRFLASVGRQGHRARPVRGGARHRDRCQGAAVGRRPREPAHPGLRSERHVRAGDEVRRACRVPWTSGVSTSTWSTASRARCCEWISTARCWRSSGRPGKGPGEFGEAHFIAVSPTQEIFVADSVNGALVKFVKR